MSHTTPSASAEVPCDQPEKIITPVKKIVNQLAENMEVYQLADISTSYNISLKYKKLKIRNC